MGKKRHHEDDVDAQTRLPKRRVHSGSSAEIPVLGNSLNTNRPPTSNGMFEETSGYQPLNHQKGNSSNPSKVYVPSSLPSPDTAEAQNGQIYESLPKLPPILNSKIAEVPFTHQGTVISSNVAEDCSNISYERLEFLGDAYVELIASRVLFPRFPDFSPGKLSQTRQLMACNETLAEFSLRYGFDRRARLPSVMKRKKGGVEDKSWTKLMGDIFEAYVAAVVISDAEKGFATVENWLIELWQPLLASRVDPEVADSQAKQVLATKIMTKGSKVSYNEERPPQLSDLKGMSIFFVGVFYTGLGYTDFCLGSGKGANKAEAGFDAATKALRHPQIKAIVAKKKEKDAKSRAEREQKAAAEQSAAG
ncbi:MAG: hypothetical protein Q9202_007025 [Teloschistes flavicans]